MNALGAHWRGFGVSMLIGVALGYAIHPASRPIHPRSFVGVWSCIRNPGQATNPTACGFAPIRGAFTEDTTQ